MENTLVTIVVCTYNSSEFIKETLDSVYNQTYKKIELIVSDDFSTDNTVEIVENWIEKKCDRFVRCEFLKIDHNTGIACNVNRGIRASKGEWIELLAGDDLLTEKCVELQMSYVTEEVKVLVGDTVHFKVENGKKVILPHQQVYERAPWFFERDAKYQYKFLLHHYNFGLSQCPFIRKWVFDNVTMYDERYLEEDALLWLNITKNGIKYYYLQEALLYYRIHLSMSHTMDTCILREKYELSKREIRKNHVYPNIPWYDICYWESELIDYILFYLAIYVFKNKPSKASKLIQHLLRKLRLLDYLNRFVDGRNMRIWKKNIQAQERQRQ